VSENNITITNTVNVPQPARGAGTVLAIVFFWPVLLMWWSLLISLWLVWLVIAAVVTIWDHEFFARTWYYPMQAWLFGIR
jgi:hypothetical protein